MHACRPRGRSAPTPCAPSSRAIARKPAAQGARAEERDEFDYREYKKTVTGSFLVAAYRRPDFRVDVTLTGDSRIAGDPLNGRRHRAVSLRRADGQAPDALDVHAHARLFGARGRSPTSSPRSAGRSSAIPTTDTRAAKREMGSDDAPLTAAGQLALTLDTDAKAGVPYAYTLEGDVEDVSRQHIANRTSLLVHPAPWYIGIKQLPLLRRAARRPEDRARRRRPRRRARART